MSLEIKGSRGSIDILGRDPFPTGGLPGQILTKADSDDTAVYWGGHLVRPNLLDNWYFVGGGSQKGNGYFPINQRGAITYTGIIGTLYGIDRWAINKDVIVNINDDSIEISASIGNDNPTMFQKMEQLDDLFEKKITISVLTKTGLFSTSGIVSTVSLSRIEVITDFGSIWFSYVESLKRLIFVIEVTPGTKASILAVKLELGEGQTLAHKEANNQWVLNKIPNFQQELAKCQRYQIEFATGSSFGTPGVGFVSSSSNAMIVLPLPVTMRNNPTLSYKGSWYLETKNATEQTGAIVTDMQNHGIATNTLKIYITTSSSNLTPGDGATLQGRDDAHMLLDANL